MSVTHNRRLFQLVSGPVLFLLCYYGIPADVFGSYAANGAVGTVLWMSLWWIFSPVDLAVTAFLPIAINAIFQLMNMQQLIANYSSEIILLLLGASIISVTWEETGLDKRIACRFLSIVGSHVRVQLLVWFTITAFLSSVLPNAVVCATIIPIAVSMLRYADKREVKDSKIGQLLLISIVYAAGVGGLATPLGGAMNLVIVQYIEGITQSEYMFTQWCVKLLPIVIIIFITNVIYLALQCKKNETLGETREFFALEFKKLGKITFEQKMALALFICATVLSFSRQFYQSYLPGLKPAYVFITCAIISFLITNKSGTRLFYWKKTQQKIVWELIYVFAGGIALGNLINATGAAKAIGGYAYLLNLDGGIGTVFFILFITIVMSDITSNTATAAVTIPIVIALIQGIGLDPIPYIYIAAIGVNLSFVLPTSIRAIPIGYGVSPKFMFHKGLYLTVIITVILTFVSYFYFL